MRKHRGRVRGLSPRMQTPHPALLATFCHKGRRVKGRLRIQISNSKCAFTISRLVFRPSFPNSLSPLKNRGRRECRVRAAPAVSCAKNCAFGAHEHTGERKHSDIPCAMALRLTSCSPRWSGLVVTVTPEKLASQELDASIAASGPHDLAVRFGVFVRARKNRADAKASITSPAQRFVTIAKRPSCGPRTGALVPVICPI